MRAVDGEGSVLVTGACGHLGHAVCNLSSTGRPILPVDVCPDATKDIVVSDLYPLINECVAVVCWIPAGLMLIFVRDS